MKCLLYPQKRKASDVLETMPYSDRQNDEEGQICAVFIVFGCLAVLAIVMGIGFMINGKETIENGWDLELESTIESCLIIDYETKVCQNKNGNKIYTYTYHAMAPHKCNETLLECMYVENESCLGTYKPSKDKDEYYVCYVGDCEDEQFSFKTGTELINIGNEKYSGGIAALIIGIVCCFAVVIGGYMLMKP
eukprot:283926_1